MFLNPSRDLKVNGKGSINILCLSGSGGYCCLPETCGNRQSLDLASCFFGAFASVDEELLRRGFHVAYYDLTHLYGSPRARKSGTDFIGIWYVCMDYLPK